MVEDRIRGQGEASRAAGAGLRLANWSCSATDAVVWVRYGDVLVDEVEMWPAMSSPAERRPMPLTEMWTGLPYDSRTAANRAPLPETVMYAPQALVVERATGTGDVARTVYCCSRIRAAGLLFSRVSAEVLVSPGESLMTTVARAERRSPEIWTRMSDEAHQTENLASDTEIEVKFSFLENVSAWEVACRTAELAHSRGLDDFVPDVGNEFQRWTYEQETFALTEGGAQKGYAAFMLTSRRNYVVKYKLYAADSLRRQETFDVGSSPNPDEFEAHLLRKFPKFQVEQLPRMTRTRFDVNVVSTRTGHFYGLETDEVRAGGQALRQLEIEYHRTQMADGVDASKIEPELFRLRDAMAKRLAAWGLAADVGYYSKLSFLRDVSRRSP